MATRSIVRIIETGKKRNRKCDLYHHWDGDPSGVGYELLYNFFNTEKSLEYYTVINHLIKNCQGYEYCSGSSYLGIEYIYILYVKEKILNVYSSEPTSDGRTIKYNGEEFYLLYPKWQESLADDDLKTEINTECRFLYPELTFEEIQDITVYEQFSKYFVKFNFKRYEMYNTFSKPDFTDAWQYPENTDTEFYSRTITNKDYWQGKKSRYEIEFHTFDQAKKFAESFGKTVKYM